MSEDKKDEVAPQEKAKAKKAPKAVAEASSTAPENETPNATAEKEVERPSQPTAKDLLEEDFSEVKIRRAKGSKNVTSGVVHVLATFNNTKVTFTDERGNVVSWSSAGKCSFRGSRKSTAYAAQVVTQDAGRVAISHGLKEVVVKLKGPGMGRDSAVRALQAMGLIVTVIEDVTPVPHNGCRPPKRRRV
jgi:small subunit ribosomal protein S11